MGATSYPGMTQPFSMGHTSNMSSVGVRQDSMGKYITNEFSFENVLRWSSHEITSTSQIKLSGKSRKFH